MAKLDWEKARQREAGAHGVRADPPPPSKRRKAKGISNAQAKLLAELCRQIDLPYMGRGLSASAASRWITHLKAGRAMRQAPGTHPWERHRRS